MKCVALQCGIAAAVLALVPCRGTAQENKAKQAGIPADEPGLVHKQMNALAGSWDVDIVFIINGKENKGKVKCESKWILDGRFLQQDYKSNLMGKPFMVLQLVGYDNLKKKTVELMMDSLSTGVLHSEGSISQDGKVITNEGESLDKASGKSTKLRTVTTIIDPDHYTLEWFKPGEAGKDEKVVSMIHTRRKQ
jgi:Protein of unknown function (DUF1579)